MTEKHLPSMALGLKPVFTEGIATAINVTMQLHDPSSWFKNGEPLIKMPLAEGVTPTARYDGKDDILASDNEGPLILTYRDGETEKESRKWYPERDPMGDINITFTAPYRPTDKNTIVGPRIDLRLDPGGGLIGQGIGFIPIPAEEGADRDAGPIEGGEVVNAQKWNISMSWDMSEAPEGMHAASSLGEEAPVQNSGSLDELINHVIFAVGPLRRYPAWGDDAAKAESGRRFVTYWMGTPPYNMDDMLPGMHAMLAAVEDYFCSQDVLRVFFRGVHNGHGGTGATLSFIIDYNQRTPEEQSEHEMSRLLAHEAVHEFALMEPIPESPVDRWWYIEGVADYVSAIGSVKHGGWSREDMVLAINDMASAYYTSPCEKLSLDYIAEHAWESIYLIRNMYNRGFIYLVRLNGLIVEATKGSRSLDDLVTALYDLRMKGEHHRIHEFRDMVRNIIGNETEEAEYRAFRQGELVVPPAAGFASLGLEMVREDAERFELGFNIESTRTNKIAGLIKGSRADLAGVREGDEIVHSFMVWGVADGLKHMMQLTVKRDDGEKTIRWWPRSNEKVECWHWVINESDKLEL